jgi:hypothetical protein
MDVRIDKELAKKINAPSTVKAVATVSKDGIPHVVYKGSLRADEEGRIVFYELIESSRNGKNLVYSIWFDKKVAVNILDGEGKSYEIIGRPLQCITCGKQFEDTYKAVRERLGDVDLSAIWIVQPEEIREETFFVRKTQEEESYPIIKHLDRFMQEEK